MPALQWINNDWDRYLSGVTQLTPLHKSNYWLYGFHNYKSERMNEVQLRVLRSCCALCLKHLFFVCDKRSQTIKEYIYTLYFAQFSALLFIHPITSATSFISLSHLSNNTYDVVDYSWTVENILSATIYSSHNASYTISFDTCYLVFYFHGPHPNLGTPIRKWDSFRPKMRRKSF